MSDKSYVGMAVHYCPYCQKNHPTGEILIDRRMKKSLQRETSTGVSLCKDCKKVLDDQDGVLLVGATRKGLNTMLNGSIIGLKREAFEAIITDMQIPEGRLIFADPEVVDMLIKNLS